MTSKRRRAVVLVLVLLSLALAAALTTPLALLSGTEAFESTYQAAALRHELAAHSAVALLPELLMREDDCQEQLDRANSVRFELAVGAIQVDVLLQDDTAKLPMQMFDQVRQRETLFLALQCLQTGLGLPGELNRHVAVAAQQGGLAWTGCLDDLFVAASDEMLFGNPDCSHIWTQFLTPVGQAVHAYRADTVTLEAALQDLLPGLGVQIVRQRGQQARPNLQELLQDIELSEPVRRQVAGRLTAQTHRYSLLVRTRLGPDVRQRYIICDAGDPPAVFADWEIAP